jgi:hypothetical protein
LWYTKINHLSTRHEICTIPVIHLKTLAVTAGTTDQPGPGGHPRRQSCCSS